jgi:beta-galactosidase/beta-glucuronidase
MAFWGTTLDSSSTEPKRKFRWQVQIGTLGNDSVVWYAKTVDKPKMTISADAQHKYLGHTFKFPGSVTWEDISVTLVDPAETNTNGQDAARRLLEIVQGSGYNFPKTADMKQTLNKPDATSALGPVVIRQLNADGATIEEWTLINPFVKSVEFDQLDYSSDELSEITLGIVYDWADLTKTADGSSDPQIFG